MRFVIGISGKSAPGSAFSVAVGDGRPFVGLRELAPAGLAAAAAEASPIEIADARARFDASGENAVAILGERRSWAIVEDLVKGAGAPGLFIFDDAVDYIARRISDGSDLDTAAADWISASSRLLRAADTCRETAMLVDSTDIATASEEFSYFCETHFGASVVVKSSGSPSPLEFVIAAHFVSTHDEVRPLTEELAARSNVFGSCEDQGKEFSAAALARVLSLYEKEAEFSALHKERAALIEQLQLAQSKAETYYQALRGKSERQNTAELNQGKLSNSSTPLGVLFKILKRIPKVGALLAERRQLSILRKSELFDAEWYRMQYPDVAAARQDPAKHFLRFGASEGRSPSAKFNTTKYLKSNPDVAAAGVNPLIHYLQFGRNEARATGG